MLLRWMHLISAIVLAAAPIANAEDWPQWRGMNRDGVWREKGIVEALPPGQIPIKWRAEIGSGYSGPTVAKGRVYVTDRVLDPKSMERVHCFDEATGKPLWSHAYDCIYRGVGYEAGPRACVTIEDGLAYSLGAMGNLFCLNAETGAVVWQKDLLKEYLIEMPIWGIAGAPLVVDSRLIVQIGGKPDACIVAFDKKTGAESWRSLDDDASYSAPIVIQQAGRKLVVAWTGAHVAALDPTTGEAVWKHPFPPKNMVIAVATPSLDKDRLLVSSFYDGSLMLKLNQNSPSVEAEWRRIGSDERHTDSLHAMIGTPLIDGDYVYGVDSHGELRCLDAKTGDRIWESLEATPTARWSTIHMVRHGEDIWMFNEKGQLIIARLSPDGFHEKSRAQLIDPTQEQLRQRGGVCWAHPAFANRHVFARNDREIVCADLSAKK